MWETLNSVDGDSTFVDARFVDSTVSKQKAEEKVSEESEYVKFAN